MPNHIDMKLLFICNQNQHRSKTAEDIFKEKFEVKSAGLFNSNPVTKEQIDWAEIIIVMENFQRAEIARRFPKEYMKKRIISLDIPDIFLRGDPELIKILENRMEKLTKIIFSCT